MQSQKDRQKDKCTNFSKFSIQSYFVKLKKFTPLTTDRVKNKQDHINILLLHANKNQSGFNGYFLLFLTH